MSEFPEPPAVAGVYWAVLEGEQGWRLVQHEPGWPDRALSAEDVRSFVTVERWGPRVLDPDAADATRRLDAVRSLERDAGATLRHAEQVEERGEAGRRDPRGLGVDFWVNAWLAGALPREGERIVVAIGAHRASTCEEAVAALRFAARVLARRACVEARVDPQGGTWSSPLAGLEPPRRSGE